MNRLGEGGLTSTITYAPETKGLTNAVKDNGNKLKSPLHRFSVHLFFNQSTISVMIFVLHLIASANLTDGARDVPLFWALCLAGLGFSLVTGYNLAVQAGQRDYNLVKYGHIQEDLRKGLKAGALSQLPGALLLALMLILSHTGAGGAVGAVFTALYYFLTCLENIIVIGAVGLILPPAVAWIGYRNGYRQIDIWHSIVYQKPNKKVDDKRLR